MSELCGEIKDDSCIVANRAFLMPQIKNGAFFEPLGHFFEDKKMPHGFGHFWAFFQDSGEKLLKNLFSKNFIKMKRYLERKKMLTSFFTNDKGDQIIPFIPFPSAIIFYSPSLSRRAAAVAALEVVSSAVLSLDLCLKDLYLSPFLCRLLTRKFGPFSTSLTLDRNELLP